MSCRVMIVEDEAVVRLHLKRLVEKLGYAVAAVVGGSDAARKAAREHPADLALVDIRLGTSDDGIELARELHEGFGLAVVFVTAFTDDETLRRAGDVGAAGYVVKPFSEPQIKAAIATAWQPPFAPDGSDVTAGNYGMVGESAAIKSVLARIEQLGKVDWTVLIQGETGTGKELAARGIHEASERRNGPFVAVNCAGLTDTLLGSQLFGHKRGAFTGAVGDQEGLFEAAGGGTLFLDEIGDVSPAVQKTLLRVLEDGMVTRLGETTSRRVDVRILCASQRDLAADVEAGHFRADLLFRLRSARLTLPPLRDRLSDLDSLIEHFISLSGTRSQRSLAFSPEARRMLEEYHWPGNVRELHGVVRHVLLLNPQGAVRPGHLPPEVGGSPAEVPEPPGDERQRILDAIERAGGNRSHAARLLGISRATLYRRMSDLGIS